MDVEFSVSVAAGVGLSVSVAVGVAVEFAGPVSVAGGDPSSAPLQPATRAVTPLTTPAMYVRLRSI